MPRFIAVHSVPFTEEALIKYAKEERPKFPEGIIWKLTYCDFDNNKHFCEWEAPNKEALEQIFRDLNIPTDAIYTVQIFDVAKAELEK